MSAPDAPRWAWYTAPITDYKMKCAHCQQMLRLGGSVVRWTDMDLYHIGCLLDRLAAYHTPAKPVGDAVSVGHWGPVLGGIYP